MFGIVSKLHLWVVRAGTTVVLVLIDDASVASQVVTGGLEICHSLCRENRNTVMLWCCMVAFMNWDSGMDN